MDINKIRSLITSKDRQDATIGLSLLYRKGGIESLEMELRYITSNEVGARYGEIIFWLRIPPYYYVSFGGNLAYYSSDLVQNFLDKNQKKEEIKLCDL